MDKQQAYQSFWEEVSGLTAYEENSVPDDAVIPYVTYQKLIDDLGSSLFPTASIWTRSSSWEQADRILNSIDQRLRDGGMILPLDNGRMFICTGSPFAQPMGDDEDNMIKRYNLNLQVEFFT